MKKKCFISACNEEATHTVAACWDDGMIVRLSYCEAHAKHKLAQYGGRRYVNLLPIGADTDKKASQ